MTEPKVREIITIRDVGVFAVPHGWVYQRINLKDLNKRLGGDPPVKDKSDQDCCRCGYYPEESRIAHLVSHLADHPRRVKNLYGERAIINRQCIYGGDKKYIWVQPFIDRETTQLVIPAQRAPCVIYDCMLALVENQLPPKFELTGIEAQRKYPTIEQVVKHLNFQDYIAANLVNPSALPAGVVVVEGMAENYRMMRKLHGIR